MTSPNWRPWTQEELALLHEQVGKKSFHDIAGIVNRTYWAVAKKAHLLGLKGIQRGVDRSAVMAKHNGATFWSDEEIEILRKSVGKSADEIAIEIQRSAQSVRYKASQLGIKLGRWSNRGADHPSWRGGSRAGGYTREFRKNRLLAFERDNYMCQEPSCGFFSPSGKKLRAHHILPTHISIDNRLENLVTLCGPCHYPQMSHFWNTEKGPEYYYGIEETLPLYQQRLLGIIDIPTISEDALV